MRGPSPAKTHRPKDLCTLEQAAHIARECIQQHEALRVARELDRKVRKHNMVWHRRLRRWIARMVSR